MLPRKRDESITAEHTHGMCHAPRDHIPRSNQSVILRASLRQISIVRRLSRFPPSDSVRFLRDASSHMRPAVAFAVGAIAGVVAVRERRARHAAERFAAASLETLLNAIDANDAQTGAHVRRVATYALVISEAAGLSERECLNVERVALFHDIGKIHEALFDIIHDPTTLTAEDRRAVATHPRRGATVLAPLCGFYPELADGVLSHHERWDGTGYPDGKAAETIPIEARLLSVADAFDAMTSHRPYRPALSVERALAELERCAGTQFDPDLARTFVEGWQRGEIGTPEPALALSL